MSQTINKIPENKRRKKRKKYVILLSQEFKSYIFSLKAIRIIPPPKKKKRIEKEKTHHKFVYYQRYRLKEKKIVKYRF